MKKEELLKDAQLLTKPEIMKLLNINHNKADKIIRDIHQMSKKPTIRGRVFIADYIKWRDRR